ncbi:uncharacterized protein MONOS_5913 [Monocercomonoides exilis]|uniref:uncharacterized protein n=1 Tax=Monocercomonoides exilis TaxID=2049356 RepID=UPI00355A36A0|nr:hypothetical protein MONOS_5913 [Monocercomonoides exilis]|eukprot:MONOS_5913.1-p1 / transcript=MONOS_5913.1 / gene=MONOS_5913 / organism=Monocercomonoides_exilis_PA203 / gene_product=unspecified product / transcript_product=unspecified product / location=Mono_scaffold00178:52729-53307(+) / protein_length=193 / sequence_SO=supercontig / SO=protein_coding / is_pseudo=false
MSDEIIFANQKYKIQGNDELSGWAASDASSSLNPAVITASAETELLKLIFSLPPSLSSHSIFISSPSSSLNLSHCSLSLQHPSSALPFLFLSVESGILIIGNFSASSINLSDYPLISLSGSSAEAELMSAPWLNMAKCYFTEMERVTGSGGCVSIDNSNDEHSKAEIDIKDAYLRGVLCWLMGAEAALLMHR